MNGKVIKFLSIRNRPAQRIAQKNRKDATKEFFDTLSGKCLNISMINTMVHFSHLNPELFGNLFFVLLNRKYDKLVIFIN
jgi:hypothetical protein